MATFCDVRNFTAFFRESAEAAYFVRQIYRHILNDYLPDATFLKPTGDGLLIIREVDERTAVNVTADTVSKSIELFRDFHQLLDRDPMITFPTPHSVGIGLARGAATRLYSGTTTLDYSGRTLNLAARLMDYARPEGLVADESIGFDQLPESVQEKFERAAVYVRGVSPRVPVQIRYTKGYTVIPDYARRPLEEPIWKSTTERAAFRALSESGGRAFLMSLPEKPSTQDVKVEVDFGTLMPDGSRSPIGGTAHFIGKLNQQGEKLYAQVDAKEVIEKLRAARVDDSQEIALTVHYPL